MDRRVMKELTKIINEMDCGLNGMKMDRKRVKELGRMGNLIK